MIFLRTSFYSIWGWLRIIFYLLNLTLVYNLKVCLNYWRTCSWVIRKLMVIIQKLFKFAINKFNIWLSNCLNLPNLMLYLFKSFEIICNLHLLLHSISSFNFILILLLIIICFFVKLILNIKNRWNLRLFRIINFTLLINIKIKLPLLRIHLVIFYEKIRIIFYIFIFNVDNL